MYYYRNPKRKILHTDSNCPLLRKAKTFETQEREDIPEDYQLCGWCNKSSKRKDKSFVAFKKETVFGTKPNTKIIKATEFTESALSTMLSEAPQYTVLKIGSVLPNHRITITIEHIKE